MASLCSAFTWPGRLSHYTYLALHGSETERIAAIRWLEQHEYGASTQALLSALDDPEPTVRAQAAASLGRLGISDAAPTWLEWSAAADPEQRALAVAALGGVSDPRIQPTLQRGVSDADMPVRLAAVQALARLGARETVSIKPLLAALRDREPALRTAALAALEAIPVANQDLDVSARNEKRSQLLSCTNDPEPTIRSSCLRALGQLRDSQTLNTLTQGLRDRDEEVRLSAIAALGDSHLSGAIPVLRAQLGAETRTTRAALAALSRSDDPAALPALASQLNVKPPVTANIAVRAARGGVADGTRPSPSAARADTSSTSSAVGASADLRAALAALLARARRVNDAETWRATVAAVIATLTRTPDSEQLTLLARAISELAPFADSRAADPPLRAALGDGLGDPVALTRALLALSSPDLPAALAQRWVAADASSNEAMLDATELALAAESGREVLGKALASRSPAMPPPERARMFVLAARAGVDSGWKPGPRASSSELQAHAEGLGWLPPRPDRRTRLLALLEAQALADAKQPTAAAALNGDTPASEAAGSKGSPSPDRAHARSPVARQGHADEREWLAVRERAAVALGRNADLATLEAVLARLATATDAETERLLLEAVGGALLTLRGGRALPEPVRVALLEQVAGPRLSGPDPTVADAALLAVRSFADPRVAPRIAQLLRGGSARQRAAALIALGDFALQDARPLLRSTLQNDSPRNTLSAALALAEIGTERDAEALLRAAEQGTWPLPAAAAYALTRIAQRGVTKKHVLERVLCKLGKKRDPYVRANVAAGFAALAAPACGAGQHALSWLSPDQPSVLRTAAAHWLQASPVAPADTAARAGALAECAHDADPTLAEVCRRTTPARSAPRGALLVRALAPDGRTALRDQLVAVRLSDGSVFVGPSDANAQVFLPHAATGSLRLEDPADAEPTPASTGAEPITPP